MLAVVTCDRQTCSHIREGIIKKQGRIVHWFFKCNKQEKMSWLYERRYSQNTGSYLFKCASFFSNKLLFDKKQKKTKDKQWYDASLASRESVLKMHWAEGDRTAEWRMHWRRSSFRFRETHIYEKPLPFGTLQVFVCDVIVSMTGQMMRLNFAMEVSLKTGSGKLVLPSIALTVSIILYILYYFSVNTLIFA